MDWTKKMIETGDGACLYTRHIGQGQPLLLIHGAVVDSEFFTDFAEILTREPLSSVQKVSEAQQRFAYMCRESRLPKAPETDHRPEASWKRHPCFR